MMCFKLWKQYEKQQPTDSCVFDRERERERELCVLCAFIFLVPFLFGFRRALWDSLEETGKRRNDTLQKSAQQYLNKVNGTTMVTKSSLLPGYPIV